MKKIEKKKPPTPISKIHKPANDFQNPSILPPQYYKYILNKEIERLTEYCDTWTTVKDSPSTPEDARYTILAAIGHTQLLIRKKFERFRGLVLDCETGKGEMLVTCKDLQGFWEMMYMEVRDCDGRFAKLERMRENGWVDEEEEALRKEVQKQQEQQPRRKKGVAGKKPVVKKKPAAGGAAGKGSSLKAMIMAARRKKMEAKEEDGDVEMKEPGVA